MIGVQMDLPKDWDNYGVYNDEMIALLRSMTPAQKIERVNELNRAARMRAATRLRRENPLWNDEDIQAEVAKKMLSGDEEYFL
jgi:hypothetical protein